MAKKNVAIGGLGALIGGAVSYLLGESRHRPPLNINVWVHPPHAPNGAWADRKVVLLAPGVWIYGFEDLLTRPAEERDNDYNEPLIMVVKGPRPYYTDDAFYVMLLYLEGGSTVDIYLNNTPLWVGIKGRWATDTEFSGHKVKKVKNGTVLSVMEKLTFTGAIKT